jgi:hypothetical protein
MAKDRYTTRMWHGWRFSVWFFVERTVWIAKCVFTSLWSMEFIDALTAVFVETRIVVCGTLALALLLGWEPAQSHVTNPTPYFRH